jgi:hypothetical protein
MDSSMKDNTLRKELLEIIYQADVSGEPGLDTIDAILLAIKNRLPKERELVVGDELHPANTPTFSPKNSGYNQAIREVKQALDIESES